MPSYATESDYRTYNGLGEKAEMPSNLASLLRAGSLAVAEYTSLAIYPTDAAGKPADRALAGVFRNAVCAHATAMHELGIDPAKGGGVDAGTVASRSIDGATITYHKGEQDNAATVRRQVAESIAPTAKRILDAAGLSSGRPWTVG